MENKLKQYRQQRKLTQAELAEAVGVTRQTIIAVENNKYAPTLRLALKIAAYFDVYVEEIFKL
ncbi:MAG: helix-turn-helix transcriptional regulator [Firmicutes bacterium]|nr:helix-turn-helix transcriptional regulator [Bacillota bacterium]